MQTNLLIKNGVLVSKALYPNTDVRIKNGKIVEIGRNLQANGEEILQANGNFIAAGFIDTHTHGANNIDFNNASEEELFELLKFFAMHGVTMVYPTVLTDETEVLVEALGRISRVMAREDLPLKTPGIHLEGPFLSPNFKGVMPEHLLKLPSLENFAPFQEAANGNIKIVTVAPELDGAMEFIEKVTADGVVVSLGHSGADYECGKKAIEKGANCSTHTFNAMKLADQHLPNIAGAVMEADIYNEIICDGLHVHPANIRLAIKTKGWDRIVAVTDSISAAGLPDGEYKLGMLDVTVKDTVARLTGTNIRAGSTLTADVEMRNLLEFTGAGIENVTKLMSKNKADLMGYGEETGEIAVGKMADIILLDENYFVKATIVDGKVVFKA